LLKQKAELDLGSPVKCKKTWEICPAAASSQIIPVALGGAQLEFQCQILLENFSTSLA